jgi:hypothetical protein
MKIVALFYMQRLKILDLSFIIFDSSKIHLVTGPFFALIDGFYIEKDFQIYVNFLIIIIKNFSFSSTGKSK